MKSLIHLLILIILLSSCKKSKSDFLWEKSYGRGEALFLRTSADSGLTSCGEIEGNPYFIRLDKNRNLKIDFSSENQGLFSSAWFDTSGYITSGNTEGKMLLMRFNPEGKVLWEKSVDGGFRIDYTYLYYTGNGTLLALGTASPDSSDSGAAGLFFVRFDTTGQIISENSVAGNPFVAAADAVVDNSGNIYIALTRQSANTKAKASVAKFNDLFQKLWETELYNNPDFGAGSLAIIPDESGNVYVAGKTELSAEEGVLNNSFLVSLNGAGTVNWKRYLESSNSGSALTFDDEGDLLMLNKNCFLVSIVSPSDGSDAGRMMLFSTCDPYNTDAFGADFDINYDKNILVAGSVGGNFYLALKSVQ